LQNERGFLTNASTATTPLSQFVPFAALSQAQIAPIATRPVLRVKRMFDGRAIARKKLLVIVLRFNSGK